MNFYKLSIILSIFIITLFIYDPNINANQKIVVIDPGHGGMDVGASFGNVNESDINLEIAFKLREVFEENGYKVILTRENYDSLCEDEFIKKEDMSKRIEIINTANASLCISIHLNSYMDERYSGAQVFYSDTNEKNQLLADSIQNSIINLLANTNRKTVKRDNILLLNKVSIPCVIVECGFLSNIRERELLLDYSYQTMLAYSIFYGSRIIL